MEDAFVYYMAKITVTKENSVKMRGLVLDLLSAGAIEFDLAEDIMAVCNWYSDN